MRVNYYTKDGTFINCGDLEPTCLVNHLLRLENPSGQVYRGKGDKHKAPPLL